MQLAAYFAQAPQDGFAFDVAREQDAGRSGAGICRRGQSQVWVMRQAHPYQTQQAGSARDHCTAPR